MLSRVGQRDGGGRPVVDLQTAADSIQRKAIRYDKKGDAHYDAISAMIKSIRGSDPDAAVYWLARMLEAGEDPRYIARRIVIAAAEDVGTADPQGLVIAQAAADATLLIGMPGSGGLILGVCPEVERLGPGHLEGEPARTRGSHAARPETPSLDGLRRRQEARLRRGVPVPTRRQRRYS